MSYILDALKRSEQDRHQGNIANLSTDMMLLPKKKKQTNWWPALIVLVLLINAAVFLYISLAKKPLFSEVTATQFDQIESDDRTTKRQTNTTLATDLSGTGNANKTSEKRSGFKEIPDFIAKAPTLQKRFDYSEFDQAKLSANAEPTDSLSPARNNRSQEQRERQYVDGGELIRPRKKAQQQPVTAYQESDTYQATDAYQESSIIIRPRQNTNTELNNKRSEAVKVTTSDDKEAFSSILHLSEYDMSFQRSIEDLKFNSHIYSDKASARRVMINNIYLREGQGFLGMQVIEIGELYVLFEKNGKQFKLPALRDWRRP
jgi:general secretion pathway protein B